MLLSNYVIMITYCMHVEYTVLPIAVSYYWPLCFHPWQSWRPRWPWERDALNWTSWKSHVWSMHALSLQRGVGKAASNTWIPTLSCSLTIWKDNNIIKTNFVSCGRQFGEGFNLTVWKIDNWANNHYMHTNLWAPLALMLCYKTFNQESS